MLPLITLFADRFLWLYFFISLAIVLGVFIFLWKKNTQKWEKKVENLLQEKNQGKEVISQKSKHQEILLEEKVLLAQQIKEKTMELAIKAKEDDDKLRLLHSIREKITEAEENPTIYKMRLKEMRRLLDDYLDIDNKTFEIQMDELHQAFFRAMKQKFPNLSIYDLRLCAYLKIGLNSKEMADIFHVLPSSINVSRSRLRKKLGLKPEEDLYAFLNEF